MAEISVRVRRSSRRERKNVNELRLIDDVLPQCVARAEEVCGHEVVGGDHGKSVGIRRAIRRSLAERTVRNLEKARRGAGARRIRIALSAGWERRRADR